MDILLATPINETHYCVPSLGLGYLVSALRKAGLHSVSLLDSVREGINYNKFAEFLKKNTPKILGIQCLSFDVPSVNRMLKIAKGINPSITTLVGGPHPSAVSGSVFSELNNLDFAIGGEGEVSLPLFVRAILDKRSKALNNIPGLIYKDGNTIKANPAEIIQDLNSLNMPAWDVIDPRNYPGVVQGGFYKDFPVGPIITSRGCPYACTFCANRILMGESLRFISVEKVIDKIEYLITNYNVKEIHILDDNFTIDKKRALDFCQRVKQRRIKTNFAFPNGVRLNNLDQETLAAMKEIGTYSLTVGIESGSQRILDHMKKGLSLDLIRDKVSLIKKLKFIVNAFFIIGYPTEKKEDIIKTIRFAKELPIDVAHFSNFLPLPGTEITRELLNSARLKTISHLDLFYSKVAFSPDGITKKELKELQQKAFLSFYLRPHILIKLLLRLKSFKHFNSILKRAKDYIFSKAKY